MTSTYQSNFMNYCRKTTLVARAQQVQAAISDVGSVVRVDVARCAARLRYTMKRETLSTNVHYEIFFLLFDYRLFFFATLLGPLTRSR
jgi:hypothetical protein